MEKEAWEGGVRRRLPAYDAGVGGASSPAGHMHQPGKPIGFLAARKTPYAKKLLSKRLILFTVVILPFLIIFNLFLICVPILWGVANHTLAVSVMHIYASNLTNIKEDNFELTIEGQVKKAGVFPAHIFFREPVHVTWNTVPSDDRPMREVQLGHFPLERIGVAAGHGRIKQITRFNITDVPSFTEFTKFLIQTKEFTWRLTCNNVHIEAFSFLPTFKNLKLTKDVVFNGINNFEDVKILDFKLPAADPQGGISYEAYTSVYNPSPFGVQLGRLSLDLYAYGMHLGPGYSPNINITRGINYVKLTGRILPKTDSRDLSKMSEIFTKYINHEVTPTVAVGKDITNVDYEVPSWLREAIKVLRLQVPFQSPEPINPIKQVTIMQFNLTYPPGGDAYGPMASSDSLSAQLAVPFGFPLRVVSAKNEITIVNEKNGKPIIMVNGVNSAAETSLDVISAGQTEGTIYLTLKPSPMSLPSQSDDARKEFEDFQKEFTFAKEDIKYFNGTSKALTETPVGTVLLNGIKFSVESGLLGLQGLNHYPTLVLGLDVIGGTRDNINIKVNTSIFNPSNVNLDVGTTTLLMIKEIVVGSVTLPDLKLAIGNNTLEIDAKFNPNAGPQGLEMLNRFISGINTKFNISGYEDSTSIASLKPAFSAVRINSTLPGLQQKLVQSTKLKVLDSTGNKDDVAQAVVSLSNPFTSSLSITHIISNVTSHGLFIASLDTDTQFNAGGKKVSQSPLLDLHLNLYPPDIFALVRDYALDAGLDVMQLDAIVKIGGYTYSDTTNANSLKKHKNGKRHVLDGGTLRSEDSGNSFRAGHELEKRKTNMFTNFNIVDFTDKAFSKAQVNLNILSTCNIGDYQTELQFVQSNVPLQTDDTLHKLLPVLAKPIVQKIIDGAILTIESVTILDPKPKSFVTSLKGSITHSGPFDASISFPDGLQVSWNGKVLGQLKMPDIKLAADEGAQLDLNAEFAVADVDGLTEFTKFLLTKPSFIWNIQGKNLRVSALGIEVGGLDISKTIILTGFNGLKNKVRITDYDLPSNDPAGGIHLTAESDITSPSQVGVRLSRFGVSVWSNGTNLGPTAAESEFTLNPLSSTNLPLAGRLKHQSDDGDLEVLSNIFTNVVHGETIPLTIQGEYAGPSEVTWLNEGIKSLKVNTILPAKHFSVIKAIDINQLTLMFSKKAPWEPKASSNNTQAPFYLPFGFPINIKQTGGGFIENYKSTDIAVLNIPYSPAQTQVRARILTLEFKNSPMSAYSSKHAQFSQFIADTTKQDCVKFQLHGKANAKADTAAGYVTVSDISFSVETSLLGIQNLNARPVFVANLDVKHGFKDYLLITVNSFMYNPSHISVGTGDVSFNLEFQNHMIGTVDIHDLVLEPGLNKKFTNVKYHPHGAANIAAGQTMLENYVQGIESTTKIHGTKDTTDIASLKQAMSGIDLMVKIPPLHKLIILEDRLVIPKNIDKTHIAQASFQLANPFTASINLIKVDAKASYKGIFLGQINDDLSKNPIRANGHQTITSRTLPIKMDLNPKNLIRFIKQAAADTGTDLGPLEHEFDLVMAMKNTETSIKAMPDSSPPNCHSGHQFDVFGAVFSLLKGLKVTLDIKSTVKIDDYKTDLNFKQEPVPTDTDDTALYLIGPVGKPIVQRIVNEAVLAFSVANATNLRNDGFDVSLRGKLVNTGPFDAQIEFPEGVSVTWSGKDIAKVYLPPVCAKADEGVPNYNTKGQLKIIDHKAFTEFSTHILHNRQFKWTIHSNKLRVRALNIIFSDVHISKDLTFDAFNGLPGVKITNFDIPGETKDSLKITSGTMIPSPASLGIQLDTANFLIFYKNRLQGPIHSNNLFIGAHTTTSATLHGFITRKDSDADRDITGDLFSNYLQGKNKTLAIKGDSVVTRANGNKPVKWLTAAFKSLTLKVVLPGKIYDIVKSAQIIDIFVTMMEQRDTWSPRIASNMTLAQYANPLHFSLKPMKISLSGILSFEGADAARLELPLLRASAGISHGPEDQQPLALSFKNQRLQAMDHGAFANFLGKIAYTSRVSFQVRGSVGIIGHMVIGDIPVKGIPFSGITSSLAGFNSFTGEADTYKADVKGATPQYLDMSVRMRMKNPSNITLKTTGMKLPSFHEGTYFGRALLDDKTIVPGINDIDAIARYQPNDPNNTVAQSVVQKFLQPKEHQPKEIRYIVPIEIQGKGFENANPPLSPFASLVPGLAQVHAKSSFPGMGSRSLEYVDNYIDLLGLFAGPDLRPFARVRLHFKNDAPSPLEIITIQSDARVAGESESVEKIATFFVDFHYLLRTDPRCKSPCYMRAAKATKVDPGRHTCCMVPNVLLYQGLLPTYKLLGNKVDVYNQLRVQVGGKNGIILPSIHFNEFYVPTTYQISIGETPVLNITNAAQFIGGLTKALSMMNRQEKLRLAQGIKKAGRNHIATLVDNGMKDLICGVEDLIPLDFLDLAGCKKKGKMTSNASQKSTSGGLKVSDASSRSSKAQSSPTPKGGNTSDTHQSMNSQNQKTTSTAGNKSSDDDDHNGKNSNSGNQDGGDKHTSSGQILDSGQSSKGNNKGEGLGNLFG